MEVRLVVERGGKRQVCRVGPPRAVVGRARGSAVRIPSAEVSRQHCRLLLEDGLVYLEDMDSINGTFLNGQRIRGMEVLRPGDRLEVGPVVFTVEYELTPEALERLRGQTGRAGLSVLAGLADGDVIQGDPVNLDLDLPDEAHTPVRLEDDEPIALDFDFDAAPWQAPQQGELRDILAQLDDGETPGGKPRKR